MQTQYKREKERERSEREKDTERQTKRDRDKEIVARRGTERDVFLGRTSLRRLCYFSFPGIPFTKIPLCMCISRSVVSDFLRPHGLQPARLLCPWNSPGKNTGVDNYSLLQGIYPTQGLNPGLPHCRQIFYHLSHQGSPKFPVGKFKWLIFYLWECCCFCLSVFFHITYFQFLKSLERYYRMGLVALFYRWKN